MVTEELIRQEIESLKQQQGQALTVYQQATGALLLAEALLRKATDATESLPDGDDSDS